MLIYAMNFDRSFLQINDIVVIQGCFVFCDGAADLGMINGQEVI